MAFGERLARSKRSAQDLERELAEKDATIARLQELDRLKTEFVATVSHELRTPLTGMIGAAKTLARSSDEMTSEERTSFLRMIERQGDRLLRLTEGVLEGARLESGASRPRQKVDLRSLVEEVVEDILEGRGRSHPIEIESDPAAPTAWGDPTAIRQIMSNLVENALKYSPSGSKVRVGVFDLTSETLLEVTDEGRGIAAGEIDSIFEKFRQTEPSATGGGVGLGLYIVKSLVDQHRGSIEVASSPGAGTTFKVRFPKRSAERES